MNLSYSDYITAFRLESNLPVLTQFGRGIERECLRVLPKGELSSEGHYAALGSALTNPFITTDYSETLLEFITPVSHKPEDAIAQLQDVQKYTLENINGELLWPLSMPCFVDDASKIPLAQYGHSNIGKMKTVYRQGLKNRYGSMMQVIAGIHFNFSFPKSFWQIMQSLNNNTDNLQDFISQGYFAALRNYKEMCWLIPYLYGSSPTICPSFLQGKPNNLPFKKSEKGYLYLEHATSLRMSDLGYTNSEQSSLQICYNDIEGYVAGVQDAINLSSEKFAEIGVKVNDEYQQLNSNVLQIENELYAPVRPKQIAKSGEKPSEALNDRGVEYIEVRALDVNPFSETGISVEQVYFLDIFITYCALKPHEQLTCKQQGIYEKNMDDVVVRGRDPQLTLLDQGQEKSVKQWGNEIFAELADVAAMLDEANNSQKYQNVLREELVKINDATKTPSAQILQAVVTNNKSLTNEALKLASQYRENHLKRDYQIFSEATLKSAALESIREQQQIEQNDQVSFDEFLTDYFAD